MEGFSAFLWALVMVIVTCHQVSAARSRGAVAAFGWLFLAMAAYGLLALIFPSLRVYVGIGIRICLTGFSLGVYAVVALLCSIALLWKAGRMPPDQRSSRR
jgi:hypothetical protein